MGDVRKLIFDRAMSQLRGFVSGREQADEKLDASRNGNAQFAEITLYVDGCSRSFNVHCDTRCSSVTKFLSMASPANICLARGPEAGTLLGVDGSHVPQFYVYLKE